LAVQILIQEHVQELSVLRQEGIEFLKPDYREFYLGMVGGHGCGIQDTVALLRSQVRQVLVKKCQELLFLNLSLFGKGLQLHNYRDG
jgi:hypothetical protein